MQPKTCVICKSAVENCVCGFDTMTKTELFLLQLRLSDLYIQHPGKLELERVPAESVIHEPGVGEMHKVAPDYSGISSAELSMRPKDMMRPGTAFEQRPSFKDLGSLLQRPLRVIDRDANSLENHQKYPQMNVNTVFKIPGCAGALSGGWVATEVKVFHIERGPMKAVSEVTAQNTAGELITFRTSWDEEFANGPSMAPFIKSEELQRLPNEWVEVSVPEVDPFPLLAVGARFTTTDAVVSGAVGTVTETKLMQFNYGICNPDQYRLHVKAQIVETIETGQSLGDAEFFTDNFTYRASPFENDFFPYRLVAAAE